MCSPPFFTFKWLATYIFVGLFSHVVSLYKAFFKNLLKLEKQLYAYKTPLCLNEPILDLIKTTHFSILRHSPEIWLEFQSLGRDQHLCLSHTISMSELAWIISWTWILSFIPTILPSLETSKNKPLLHNWVQNLKPLKVQSTAWSYTIENKNNVIKNLNSKILL